MIEPQTQAASPLLPKILRPLNAVLALVFGALALYWLIDMYRGSPESYPHEHAAGFGISFGSLVGCIATLVRRPWLQATLSVGSLLMILGVLGLMFGNRG